MRACVLVRLRTGDDGTFGLFYYGGGAGWAFSLELPWRENRSNISCIPPGAYRLQSTYSPAFNRRLPLVHDVPGGRSGIRIHAGNLAGDKSLGYRSHVLGCILLGTGTGTIQGQRGIVNSATAVETFIRWLGEEPALLTVKEG